MDPTLNLTYAELDEFKAGRENRWNYLGQPLEAARRVDLLGQAPNLLANGDFERDMSGATLALLGNSKAVLARDETQAGQGKAALRISVSQLDADPSDNKVRIELGPFAVQARRDYTLRFKVRADPKYVALDAAYAGLPRRVALLATVGGKAAPASVPQALALDILADGTWRDYSLSFTATVDDARATLSFQLGREGGEVWLDDLRLVQGPGDVFVRSFERGVVLVNGSGEAVSFDLATLFPGVALRRISGTQDPAVNNGTAASGTLTLPAHDALILLRG